MNPPASPIISGFVLAGGKSLRMGRDKSLLEWGHHSLLDHMVQLLSTATSPVRVVGKQDLPDKIQDRGPLGGILTALEVTTSDMNLVVAVDLPLLTTEFLKWFCSRMAGTSKALTACRIGTRFPLCLGIHRNVLPHVADRVATGDLTLHSFIQSLNGEIVTEAEITAAGFPGSIFENANTPEDWNRLKR